LGKKEKKTGKKEVNRVEHFKDMVGGVLIGPGTGNNPKRGGLNRRRGPYCRPKGKPDVSLNSTKGSERGEGWRKLRNEALPSPTSRIGFLEGYDNSKGRMQSRGRTNTGIPMG